MKYWLSCTKMTVFVEIDSKNMIIDTAPITRKFIGQHINNLINWMKKLGDFKIEKLN